MPITKYVSEWLARVEDDMLSASVLLRESSPPNTTCFLCQQAAEKCFKAFLAFSEKHVRKIHNLPQLVDFCAEIDPSFKSLDADAKHLTAFYVETRYPADMPEFTLSQAKAAYEAALRIKEFVMLKIDQK